MQKPKVRFGKICTTCRRKITGSRIYWRMNKAKTTLLYFCSSRCNAKNLESRTDAEGLVLFGEALSQMIKMGGLVMKFVHKPNVVEAMKVTPTNGAEICAWAGTDKVRFETRTSTENESAHHIIIESLSGLQVGKPGDFIIRGPKDFYPCKPDVFEESYEEYVEPGSFASAGSDVNEKLTASLEKSLAEMEAEILKKATASDLTNEIILRGGAVMWPSAGVLTQPEAAPSAPCDGNGSPNIHQAATPVVGNESQNEAVAAGAGVGEIPFAK